MKPKDAQIHIGVTRVSSEFLHTIKIGTALAYMGLSEPEKPNLIPPECKPNCRNWIKRLNHSKAHPCQGATILIQLQF